MSETIRSSSETSSFEREKWSTEVAFRERELSLKERQQQTQEAELEIKRRELRSTGWRSPLVIAILAATLAAAGNIYVENVKAQHAREEESRQSYRTAVANFAGLLSTAVQQSAYLLWNAQNNWDSFSSKDFEEYEKEMRPLRSRLVAAQFLVAAHGSVPFNKVLNLGDRFFAMDAKLGIVEREFRLSFQPPFRTDINPIASELKQLYADIGPTISELLD
jgi:hypothetical protein